MDTEESHLGNEYDELIKLLERPTDNLEVNELSKPAPKALDDILNQRKQQRAQVLKSVTKLMWFSFWLLVILLMWQSIVRTFIDSDFELLDSIQLQILSVSIFGQIIAVVVVISKALWDDKAYMEKMK